MEALGKVEPSIVRQDLILESQVLLSQYND